MYLGVDGGGTKTAFVVVDDHGHVTGFHEDAGSYHVEVGVDGVRDTLRRGISAVCRAGGVAPGDLRAACLGLPAFGEDDLVDRQLQGVTDALLPGVPHQCVNDMVCGWAGALAGRDGISVVAGTGSIAYGEWAGRSARAGGWGEIFSDEGSAYWIAREGLELFSRMSDGRSPRGPLHRLVVERLGLARDIDLCALVYREWRGERGRLAQVCPLVEAAAVAGDAGAAEIFERAAAALADLVDATRHTLAIPGPAEVPVSYSGGVFRSGELIMRPLRAELAALRGHYRLATPRFSPAVGAALQAAKLAAAPLAPAALDRLVDPAARLLAATA